jgi:hypothetical protein
VYRATAAAPTHYKFVSTVHFTLEAFVNNGEDTAFLYDNAIFLHDAVPDHIDPGGWVLSLHKNQTGASPTSVSAFAVNVYQASGLSSLNKNLAVAPGTPGGVNGSFVRLQPVSSGSGTGDPVFTGFHGQFFRMKGAADRVFNIVAAPGLLVNAYFGWLAEGQSMTSAQMRDARLAHAASNRPSSSFLRASPPAAHYHSLPRTVAYNHPGTYMTQAGLVVGMGAAARRVYVAAGNYTAGFSRAEVRDADGQITPLSDEPLELAAGVTVTRLSDYRLQLDTPILTLILVNADHFFNIDALLRASYSPQLHMTGLLGQTADPSWKTQSSREWWQHIEQGFMLADQDLFAALKRE